MTVRTTNWPPWRRSTRASRASSAPKVGPAERARAAHSRYSRPVRARKTVSRLGGWLVASRTWSPSSVAAITSAASTPVGLVGEDAQGRAVPLRRAHAVERRGALLERVEVAVDRDRDHGVRPELRFSSAGAPSASTLPWSMIAIRSQSVSASSM